MNRREEWIMERKEAIGLCICGMCPSFLDCREEIAYCFSEKGMSGCIKTEQGCLCPGCPVQAEEDFLHVYYCTRGSEAGQSHAR
jgi:hypothetical protein